MFDTAKISNQDAILSYYYMEAFGTSMFYDLDVEEDCFRQLLSFIENQQLVDFCDSVGAYQSSKEDEVKKVLLSRLPCYVSFEDFMAKREGQDLETGCYFNYIEDLIDQFYYNNNIYLDGIQVVAPDKMNLCSVQDLIEAIKYEIQKIIEMEAKE